MHGGVGCGPDYFLRIGPNAIGNAHVGVEVLKNLSNGDVEEGHLYFCMEFYGM